MLIYVFFSWFIHTCSVVLTWFVCDSSVKISRKDPQLFSLLPITNFRPCNISKMFVVAVRHGLKAA